MTNELRSRLVPTTKKTLFIWTLLAALLLTAVLYASGLVSVTNAQTPPGGYTFNSALPHPTGLNTTVTANNKVVILRWTAPADTTVEGYQIQRKTNWDDDNFAIIVANTGDQKTKYRDTSITVPGVYRYRVSMVQGTEVSSSSEVLTTNVSLVAPPPPVQTGPSASVSLDPTKAATLDELYRLEESVADAAAGCLLYEVPHAFKEGWSTYTTEMDGIHCIPLRDLMLENCVPSTLVSSADKLKYTVGSYAAGQPAFLSSHLGKITVDRQTYTSMDGQKSYTYDADVVGKWPNDAILKYNAPGRGPSMQFELSSGRYDLNYEAGTADRNMGTGHDKIVSDLMMLHDRLVDITQTERFGQYYLPAANCHFYGDEADTIADADSEITLATAKYGGKDPGQDIDVFYVDMVQDVEYEVHIQGLDPTSEDARLALAGLHISDQSNHSISEIEPRMKVLDADGNSQKLVLHGETETFMPDATARYYLKVWDDAYVRGYMSGLYKIVINIVGESAGDVGEGRANAMAIQADTLISGRIGFADDSDWYSFTIGGRNEAHTIMLDGDVTNHDLLINPALAIMKPNGRALDADDQNIRDHDGYIVIELRLPREPGDYYAAVSAADQGHHRRLHPGPLRGRPPRSRGPLHCHRGRRYTRRREHRRVLGP